MTTPNEELILKLRGQAYTTCRPDQLCDQAADLLQSQAERIKELEEEIGGWREDQKENIGVAFALQREVNKITSERDELREKYTDTYWALNDAARENTSLRAQLTEIAATEPVATLVVEWVFHEYDNSAKEDRAGYVSTSFHRTAAAEKMPIGKYALFTRPIPAQDVTELVDALEHYANPANWQEDFKGVQRTWLEPDSDTRNVYSGFELAAKALSKYKGAK